MIFLKTLLAFILILVLTRLLGKKQMSQMTFFHYITGITIGSIAASIIVTDDHTILDEVFGLLLWCGFTALLAFLTLKFKKLRLLVDGQPTMLIKNGKLQRQSLMSTRVSIEDLCMMLRAQGVFSITEVDYAILEPNGSVSILKKQIKLNLTREDMNLDIECIKFIPTQIIIDGKIIIQNLLSLGLDLNWVNKQLDKEKIKNIKDVFYAEVQSNGSLYIDKLKE